MKYGQIDDGLASRSQTTFPKGIGGWSDGRQITEDRIATAAGEMATNILETCLFVHGAGNGSAQHLDCRPKSVTRQREIDVGFTEAELLLQKLDAKLLGDLAGISAFVGTGQWCDCGAAGDPCLCPRKTGTDDRRIHATREFK